MVSLKGEFSWNDHLVKPMYGKPQKWMEHDHLSNEKRAPWLVGLYKGLYYPVKIVIIS